MIWEDLQEDLVVMDLEAESSEEVFRKLGGKLIEAGYCKESYVEALINREKDFPTGINMGEIGIAMPHTDREHVNKSGIAIARLKNPVKFFQMGTLDVEVQARIIFMLAVEDPDAHLIFLQRIIILLQDETVLQRILSAKDKQEIITMIKEKEQELDAPELS